MTLPTSPAADGYDAGSITILSGLEPVRQRPGMYIGSTGAEGLHHLAAALLADGVDACPPYIRKALRYLRGKLE